MTDSAHGNVISGVMSEFDHPDEPNQPGQPGQSGQPGQYSQHFPGEPAAPAPQGRPARPRSVSLLDDQQRAAFLAEWDTVQTSFVADPRRAAEAAENLVTTLADAVTRRVGEITDAIGRPAPEPADGDTAGSPAPDDETWRNQLLRCREAFHLLIDS